MFSTVKIFGMALLATTLLFAGQAKNGDKIKVAENDTIRGDYLVAGESVYFKGYAARDLLGFAQTVQVEGNVFNSLFGFAQIVNSSGEIGGNVYAFAQHVIISGHVKGNLFVMAQYLTLQSGAEVDGSVFFGGEKLKFSEGAVIHGDLTMGAERAVMAGELNGKAEVHVEKADFKSSFKAGKQFTLHISEEYAEGLENTPENMVLKREKREIFFEEMGFYWGLFSAVVIGLLILLLFPGLENNLMEAFRDGPVKSGFFGLALIVFTPIIAGVAIIVYPLTFILLALYFVALYLGFLASAVILNEYAFKDKMNHLPGYVLSMVIIYLLTEVPYFGGLIEFAAVAAGCGLIVSYVMTAYKNSSSAS
jgi:cytoskeletal protein CcmA (bactofilin family)